MPIIKRPLPTEPKPSQTPVTLLWPTADGSLHVTRISLDAALKAVHSTKGST